MSDDRVVLTRNEYNELVEQARDNAFAAAGGDGGPRLCPHREWGAVCPYPTVCREKKACIDGCQGP